MNILEQIRTEHAAWEKRVRYEGRREGRQEGRQEVLLRLLNARFGPLTEDVIERIRRADRDQLQRWTERVLTADSLAQVLA